MEPNRAAYRCLECDTLVAPEGAWEQCKCGQMYVDTSMGGGLYKHSSLFPDRVQDESTFSKSEQRRRSASGDKFTTSKMTEKNGDDK